MIRVFTGDNRAKAEAEIKRVLGSEYEVFEGESLKKEDLASIFLGGSLFASERKILLKDVSENREVFEAFANQLEDFLRTDAEVILFEMKLDKRTAAFKEIKRFGVEISEFKLAEKIDFRRVFDIYNIALRDGKLAVQKLEKIELDEDPYMFFGVLVSQALKKFAQNLSGEKEKRALKELSRLDILMKTTSYEPWILIKGFLVRLSSL